MSGLFALLIAMSLGAYSDSAYAGYNTDPPDSGAAHHYSGSFSRNHNNPYLIPDYVRKGTKARVNYSFLEKINHEAEDPALRTTITGSGYAVLTCSSPNSSGGWHKSSASLHMSGNCWDAYTIRYYQGGVLQTHHVPANPIDLSDVHIQPVSACHGSNKGAPSSKDYCVFGTSDITGDTGDDMFRVKSSASGFLEYMKISDDNGDNSGLKYIRRNSSGRDLMLPSGPPGDYDDFYNFMDNGPLNTEAACQTAKVSVCPSSALKLDAIPPLDGICGRAQDNSYSDIAHIQSRDMCQQGIPAKDLRFNKAQSRFEWSCNGIGSPSRKASCHSVQSIDGRCNPDVNGAVFQTEAELKARPLCASGNVTGFSKANDGRWIWTCEAIGQGAESQACLALKPGFSCDEHVGDVMYIMDDSGSMGGAPFRGSMSGTKISLAKDVMKKTFLKHINKEDTSDPDRDRIGIAGLNAMNKMNNKRFLNWNGSSFDSMASDGVTSRMRSKGSDWIRSFKASGGTPLYARIQEAAKLMGSGSATEPNAIIAFSDGGSSGSMQDTINVLKRYSHLRVHTVDVEDNKNKLQPLSKETGGLYVKAENEAQFQALLDLTVLGCEKKPPPPVHAQCGSTPDTCNAGTYADMGDSSTHYMWTCNGQHGGQNKTCHAEKPPQPASCGNGKREGTEACDSGTANSDRTTNGCNESCQIQVRERCEGALPSNAQWYGDGFTWRAQYTYNGSWEWMVYEGVDGGRDPDQFVMQSSQPNMSARYSPSNDHGDMCDFTCKPGTDWNGTECIDPDGSKSVCGNGKREGLEACDDGNTNKFDGCDLSCTKIVSGSCGSLPANASYYDGRGVYSQYQKKYNGPWIYTNDTSPQRLSSTPGATSAFYSSGGDSLSVCDFHCDAGYEWTGSRCAVAAQAKQCSWALVNSDYAGNYSEDVVRAFINGLNSANECSRNTSPSEGDVCHTLTGSKNGLPTTYNEYQYRCQ